MFAHLLLALIAHDLFVLIQVLPAFGQKNNDELTNLYRNGIFDYGPAFSGLYETLLQLVQQTRVSERTPLMTVMLEVREVSCLFLTNAEMRD